MGLDQSKLEVFIKKLIDYSNSDKVDNQYKNELQRNNLINYFNNMYSSVIFDCVLTSDYNRLDSIKFKYEESVKKDFQKDYYDFYLKYDLIQSLEHYIDNVNNSINSDEYDIISIMCAYCEFKIKFFQQINFEIFGDKIDIIENMLFVKAAKEILDNDYTYEHSKLFDYAHFIEDANAQKVFLELNDKFFMNLQKIIFEKMNKPISNGYSDILKKYITKMNNLANKLCYKKELDYSIYADFIENKIKDIIEILLQEEDLEDWEWHESLALIKFFIYDLKNNKLVEDVFIRETQKSCNNRRIDWFKKYFKFDIDND